MDFQQLEFAVKLSRLRVMQQISTDKESPNTMLYYPRRTRTPCAQAAILRAQGKVSLLSVTVLYLLVKHDRKNSQCRQ